MKAKSKSKRSSGRKSVKASAMELVRQLSPDCTWDDLLYRLQVRRKIEEGIQDADAGNLFTHEEVFKEYDS